MRSFISVVFLGAFLLTSASAAAINRRTAIQHLNAAAPILLTKSIPDLGARGNVLKPINSDTFKSASNLQVRDAVDFSRLDLVSQAELIFGAPGDNGNVLLANMTLYAPDGQQIVMMESFEGLTSAVDCKGDDGVMSLTFTSKDAFNAALSKWSVINERVEDSFLLIANHDGCGPDDQRQAYTISEVTNDEASLVTTLAAETAPWSEIAGTFDMSFGTATVAPGAARRLLARDFFDGVKDKFNDVVDKAGDIVDDVEDFGNDVVDGAKQVVGTVKDGAQDAVDAAGDAVDDLVADAGNTKLGQEAVFDVSIGQQGKRFNLFTDPINPVPLVVLDCVDCFITGKFKVAGSLSVTNFQVQQLVLSASPEDFQSKLEVEAKIEASTSIGLPGLKLTQEVASFPVPGAGIVIPGIFELGAVISYEVAIESSITGTANFTFGLLTSIPNSAAVVADLANIDASSATGFGSITFDPTFEINSGSGTLNIAAVSRPKLTFGVDIVGIGKIEAGLNLSLPRLSAALTAAFDQAGVCSQTAGASKTGLKVTSDVTISLDLSVNGKFGLGGILDAGTLFQTNLLTFEKPLLDKCFPINVSGLDGASPAANINGTTAYRS